MKHKFTLTAAAIVFASIGFTLVSCEKDYVAPAASTTLVATPTSFVEQFDNVGDLSAKGWAFKNNSEPIGQSGWRQGRYEAAAIMQYGFFAPEPFIGFPAYNSTKSPNDFISCDATAVNSTGNISSWLISPSLPMKNGDQIIFYTRAINDDNYPVYIKDRMQVWANFFKGGIDVGSSSSSTGSFDSLLVDINPNYLRNDPTGNPGGALGYPRAWAKVTLTVKNLPAAGVTNGRFAFRYLGTNAGVNGLNYPGVVGVDSLAFVHQ